MRVCNTSRIFGQVSATPKFCGPNAAGSSVAMVHSEIFFKSPLQQRMRIRGLPYCATSAMSWRHRPHGVTISERTGGSVNLWPITAITSTSKSPAK